MTDLVTLLSDPNVLAIVLFVTVSAVLLWRDRENVERYSVVFVRRTKKGIDWLDRIATVMPRIWRQWANLGVVIGFGLMIFIFAAVFYQTAKMFLIADAAPAVAPVLPTVETFAWNPAERGYVGIPFIYFMIGISVVLIVHEMMHGVIARVEDFEIEYVGLLLLAFIPGAFVQPKGQKDFFEPEEDDDVDEEGRQSPWDQGSWLAQLRVLGAGPWANVTTTLVIAALLFTGSAAAGAVNDQYDVYNQTGMEVLQVADDSPAAAAGIEEGTVITAINGNRTTTVQDFHRVTQDIRPQQAVQLTFQDGGTRTVTATVQDADNYTFQPAAVDYLLPHIEQRFPGTIDRYADLTAFMDGDPRLERERWQWIQEQYPFLADRAEQRVAELDETLEEPEEDGYIGIRVQPATETSYDTVIGVLTFLYGVGLVVAMLNLFIGTANLLPIKGLDGGWMLSILADRFAPRHEQRITRGVTAITLGMVLFSFLFVIIRFAL